jgi:hypothetical protein
MPAHVAWMFEAVRRQAQLDQQGIWQLPERFGHILGTNESGFRI